MPIDRALILAAVTDFFRLMNKFGKLEKQALDFGTGELLSPVEIHTLSEIGMGRGQTVTDLCRLFGVTKGAVSQIVGKLTRRGYISKARNEDYGKEILLTLTDKGQKAFRAHIALHNAMDDRLVAKFADVDARQILLLQESLKQIEEHIDRYLELDRRK